MLQKRRSQSPKVYAFFAVLLAFPLTQIEASTLKGNADQNGQKESTEVTSGYKPGVIEVGKSLKRSEDDSDYQADGPGWHIKGQQQQQQIKSMFPWVMCGPNDMKFSAFGGHAKHFTMNTMPPSCGSNMQRNPFGLVVRVPYDGCNVELTDGWYNLPLLWNDIPVTAKCPKSDAPTVPPFPWPWQPHHTGPTQYPPFPWFLWTVPQTTPAAPQNPLFPFPKFPPGLQHQHPYPWVFPTPAPSQQHPVVPQFPGVYMPPHWLKHPPAQTTVPSQDPLPKYWWPKHPLYPGQTPSLPSQSYWQYMQHLKFPMDPQHPHDKPWLMSQ